MHVRNTGSAKALIKEGFCSSFFSAELQDYGWKRSNGSLEVVWEVPENVAKVQARLEFAFDGCSC